MRPINSKEPNSPDQLYKGFELEDDSLCNWMVDPIIRELDCNTPKGGIKDLYYVNFTVDQIKKFESDFFKSNAWKNIIKND